MKVTMIEITNDATKSKGKETGDMEIQGSLAGLTTIDKTQQNSKYVGYAMTEMKPSIT